jgi:hypothetical protein
VAATCGLREKERPDATQRRHPERRESASRTVTVLGSPLVGLALDIVILLGGLIFVTNFQGVSEHFHSILRLAWRRMDDTLFSRMARVYVIPGAIPFWAFRAACFLTMVCGGTLALIYGPR